MSRLSLSMLSHQSGNILTTPHTRGSQKVMPPGFNSGYLCAGYVKTSQRFAGTLQKTVIFQCSLQLCHSFLPLLSKRMYSQWVKVACSSSAATGTQCSAVPHYWHSDGLTGFF